MKRLLFLTPTLSRNANSGGLIKTNKILEELSDNFVIDIVCINNDFEDKASLESFKKDYNIESVFVGGGTRDRSFLNLLKSYLKALPLSVYRNYYSVLKNSILDMSCSANVIFVDHFLMAEYVPISCYFKSVFHQHNAEYMMWNLLSEVERNPLKKMLIKIESERIKKYERFYCRRFNKTIAAPNDIENLSSLGVKKDKFVKTLHLGSNVQSDNCPRSFGNTKNQILYVGTLSWLANTDGLIWFLKEVWPKFKLENPTTSFKVVGRGASQELIDIVNVSDDVFLLGFVESLDELYDESRVFVAPLRFGSGIKVKVAEGLSMGIPIVSTPVGVEGLDLVSGKELFYSDSTEELVSFLNILIDPSNEQLWEEMSKSSVCYSTRELSWDKVLSDISKTVIRCQT